MCARRWIWVVMVFVWVGCSGEKDKQADARAGDIADARAVDVVERSADTFDAVEIELPYWAEHCPDCPDEMVCYRGWQGEWVCQDPAEACVAHCLLEEKECGSHLLSEYGEEVMCDCGTCPVGQSCLGSTGLCCHDSCDGRACGFDCDGHSCGTCEACDVCVDGQCETPESGTLCITADCLGGPECDAMEPPREFLCQCDDHSDCWGSCLEIQGGGFCTYGGGEECPAGFEMRQMWTGNADVVFVCVPWFYWVCRPCTSHDDCWSGNYDQVSACVDFGASGSFCSLGCTCNGQCPKDMFCDVSLGDELSPGYCIYAEGKGECDCLEQDVLQGREAACQVTNESGTCTGVRVCTADGLTPCDAKTPEAEVCNHVDDDCDGEVDEDLDGCEFVGSAYELVSVLDLSEGVAGEALELVNLVVDLAYDPSVVVKTNTLAALKESAYEGHEEAWPELEFAVTEAVVGWWLDNAPDFNQDLFIAGQDLGQVLKEVEVQSTLELESKEGDLLVWNHTFKQVVLTWSGTCPPDAPAGDACHKHLLSADQLAEAAHPVVLGTVEVTGMVANGDKLIVDTHTWPFGSGSLVLMTIEEIFLPAVASQNDLVAVVDNLMDCKAIADDVDVAALADVELTPAAVEQACEAAWSELKAPVLDLISMTGGDTMALNGKCDLSDEDGTFGAEKLVNGKWMGNVIAAGQQGGEVSGTFEGTE